MLVSKQKRHKGNSFLEMFPETGWCYARLKLKILPKIMTALPTLLQR